MISGAGEITIKETEDTEGKWKTLTCVLVAVAEMKDVHLIATAIEALGVRMRELLEEEAKWN